MALPCSRKKDRKLTTSETNNAVPPEPESSPVQQKPKFDWRSLNTLAVVSIASALTSFGGLLSIITGHISLAQLKTSGENGKALAITGLVLGYLQVVLGIIFVVSQVLFFALVDKGMIGLQPGMPEFFEFRRGFGDFGH